MAASQKVADSMGVPSLALKNIETKSAVSVQNVTCQCGHNFENDSLCNWDPACTREVP
jgi:hypothetical protein